MAKVRAFVIGIGDGWNESTYLSTSTNIDHLPGSEDDIYNWQDRGINLGQFARAGFNSQAWRNGYWPFRWNGRTAID